MSLHLQKRQSIASRTASLLCVAIVLALDVLAVMPEWHEALCHHHSSVCDDCGSCPSDSGSDPTKENAACDCVITKFAAGQASGFGIVVELTHVELLSIAVVDSDPINPDYDSADHLWPHPGAPPVYTE
jgi:hypothetical protein